jgi:hypothetical protein
MKIWNRASIDVSWFCFNANDSVKLIALASGNLDHGKAVEYNPPRNGSGATAVDDVYFVRFTGILGGTELAGAQLLAKETIQLEVTSKFKPPVYKCNTYP